MKKIILLILAGIAPFIFWSCSDDDTPVNPGTSNYFPMTIGNYWVYEKYGLDSNNNRISTTLQIDSVYCNATTQEVINNTTQTVYTYTHHSSALANPDQQFYVSNDQIYQKYQILPGLDLTSLGFNVRDYIPIDWMLLIDQKNANWTSFPKQTINIPSLNIPNISDLSLNLEMIGKSVGTGTFIYQNKTINTKNYELDWNVSGTLKSGNFTVAIPAFTLKTVYKLADGIGIVSIITNSQKVSIMGLTSFQFKGSETSLIRSKILVLE